MLALQKILLPVDFSAKFAGASRYAKALAVRFQSHLILLHVVEPLRVAGGPELTLPADTLLDRRGQAEMQLREFLREELQDLQLTRTIREGDPAQEIIQHAQDQQADLILMPTHGYGTFRRFLLGSVSAKVLHDSDCPVWTGVHLEEAPAPETISIQRVACALDLGPQSARVLAWAWNLASSFEARLSVIHVTAPVGFAVAAESEPEAEAEQAARASADIEDLLANCGAKGEITVDSGDVTQTVYDFAARLPADVLVIGRGVAKGIVGRLRSHAYSIIRESPCPVVSV